MKNHKLTLDNIWEKIGHVLEDDELKENRFVTVKLNKEILERYKKWAIVAVDNGNSKESAKITPTGKKDEYHICEIGFSFWTRDGLYYHVCDHCGYLAEDINWQRLGKLRVCDECTDNYEQVYVKKSEYNEPNK